MKKTRWFPPEVKPVHVGVYETEQPNGERWLNYFDGNEFHYGDNNVSDALGRIENPSSLPSRLLKCWRGLAEKPQP